MGNPVDEAQELFVERRQLAPRRDLLQIAAAA